MEHQEESGNHRPATGGNQGAATTADKPAPGEGVGAGEEVPGVRASIPRGRTLPHVQVAWVSGNWAPLFAGR